MSAWILSTDLDAAGAYRRYRAEVARRLPVIRAAAGRTGDPSVLRAASDLAEVLGGRCCCEDPDCDFRAYEPSEHVAFIVETEFGRAVVPLCASSGEPDHFGRGLAAAGLRSLRNAVRWFVERARARKYRELEGLANALLDAFDALEEETVA